MDKNSLIFICMINFWLKLFLLNLAHRPDTPGYFEIASMLLLLTGLYMYWHSCHYIMNAYILLFHLQPNLVWCKSKNNALQYTARSTLVDYLRSVEMSQLLQMQGQMLCTHVCCGDTWKGRQVVCTIQVLQLLVSLWTVSLF